MSAAAFDAAASTQWPRRRLLLTALAVSLALNLFFLAGAVWGWLHGPPSGGPAERYSRIAPQLDLNPQQREIYDRYVAAMRGRGEQMRRDVEPLFGAAFGELAKPDARFPEIEKLIDQAAEKRRLFLHETIAQTATMLNALSPEQRAKFIALMRERRGDWRRPPADRVR